MADLTITKTDGAATSIPGGNITYTIAASNGGPADVMGATVTDTFPAVLTCTWTCSASAGSACTVAGAGDIIDSVNLLVGGTATYTAICAISPGATGSLSNTASIATPGGVTETNIGDNSATDTNTLTSSADLSITKDDGVTTATPGNQIVYTIVAQNNGPAAVTDAIVADTFAAPLQNCSWTSVAAGGATGNTNSSGNLNDTLNLPVGASVTYTVTCDIDAAGAGTLSNTATINSATATDPTPGNDSATDNDTALVPATGNADLSITKDDGVTTATPGGTVTYTIVAGNNGPDAVTDAVVIDTFAAPLQNCSWTSVAAGGATGNTNNSGNLNDTLNLPVGASVTYTVTCDIDAAGAGTLSNTAMINSATATDPTPGNTSATDNNTALVPTGAVAIPTMSQWAVIIMVLSLTLFGAFSVRRQGS